jgi:thiamine pyrophosphokinase
MMPYKYFSNIKSILCLDGDLPDSKFFSNDKVIIAADGAANKLKAIGINPDIIIGDLDSIKRINYPETKIIHLPDQNQTDFGKSIEYIKQNNLNPTMITGVSGGFIDHIFNNINIILDNDLFFYSEPIIGFTINEGIFKTNLPINSKISLFGINEAKVKTKGLKWELDNEILTFPGKNSCSNRVAKENISIEITKGKVLVFIYLEDIKDNGSIINSLT